MGQLIFLAGFCWARDGSACEAIQMAVGAGPISATAVVHTLDQGHLRAAFLAFGMIANAKVGIFSMLLKIWCQLTYIFKMFASDLGSL